MRFPWRQNLHLEDKSKRTHTIKDFAHPTDANKRILIQSAGLLHYYDGESFKDLEELPFPEGKEIATPSTHHFMMDLPMWGREELSPDKKTLRIYDKKDQPIYVFSKPLVVSKDNKPFRVVKRKDGTPVRDTTNRDEIVNRDEVVIRLTNLIDDCEFEVEANKLYLKVPSQLKNSAYPLQAYDATDTSSTNNKDSMILSWGPNTNYGSSEGMYIYRDVSVSQKGRLVMEWTLSSGSGTITDVKLYLLASFAANSPTNIDVHELTQAFTELGVTWNKYDGTNNWATPGGDYSATIIDTVTATIVAGNWYNWVLMGTGATNPLTLNWGDTFDVLLKFNDEGGIPAWQAAFRTKEWGTPADRPYIEITYTVGVVGRSHGYIF
jgi:hypothetical protein